MGKVNHQPKGMKPVNPYLLVDKVSDLIDFVETVSGGTLKYKLDRSDGIIIPAEIIIGDSIIMAG